MMVGYADLQDVVNMWNPRRRKIHVTRDTIWLKQMLFKKQVDKEAVVPDVQLDAMIRMNVRLQKTNT